MLSALRYILKGNDAYLIAQAVNLLKGRCEPGFESVCFSYFKAEASYEQVLDFCRTPSFGNMKVCVISPPPAVEKRYLELFENAPEDTVLALIDREGKFKFLEDVAEVIDCSKLSAQKAQQMIQACGLDIDANAVQLLIERTEGDGYRLKNELDKLIAYAYGGAQITAAEADALVAVSLSQDVFTFSNAVSAQNIREAHKVLNNLFIAGIKPEALLPLLTGAFRKMLAFSLAKETGAELAVLYKIKPGAVEINRKIAKRFGVRRLKDAVDMLVEADYVHKSGKASVRDLLWICVAKI